MRDAVEVVTYLDRESDAILRDGRRVMLATLEAVRTLLAEGYRVQVCDSRVLISPPVHGDVQESLEPCWSDVAAILEHLQYGEPSRSPFWHVKRFAARVLDRLPVRIPRPTRD